MKRITLPSLALSVMAFAPLCHAQFAPPLDVTFFVTSDTHVCTARDGITVQVAKDHVKAINTATSDGPFGKQVWPAGLPSAGQRIAEPRGLLIAGDIGTDKLAITDGECWDTMQELYSGRQQFRKPWSPRFPVFPAFGNHDWSDHDCRTDKEPDCGNYTFNANTSNRKIAEFIVDSVRPQVTRLHWPSTGIEVASAPPLYSWDWGRLHLVSLNTFAGEPYRRVNGIGLNPGNYSDNGGWEWLASDLKANADKYGPKAPVVIFQHYGYDEFSRSGADRGYRKVWWSDADRARFESIIKDYNVVAFFTGHNHDIDTRTFGPGGKYLNVSSGNGSNGDRGGFWAVHVTDSNIEMAYLFKKIKPVMDGETFTNPAHALSRRISTSEPFVDGRFMTSLAPGYNNKPKLFADVNGDKRMDYCRFVDADVLRCTLASPTGFEGGEIVSPRGFNAGWDDKPRAFVDVNGDGFADYCRVTGSNVLSCALANPATGKFEDGKFQTSGLDLGYANKPRMFVDVNGDGKADYCRFVGSDVLKCTLAGTGGFNGGDIASPATFAAGYGDRPQVFVDVNGDGYADYCRLLGSNTVTCALSNPAKRSFDDGKFFTGLDFGYKDKPAAFIDVNGDGKADYCRFMGANQLVCSLAGTSGFNGGEVRSTTELDAGYANKPRVFVDIDGDGKGDYCRVVSNNILSCALATKDGFVDGMYRSLGDLNMGYDNQLRSFVNVQGRSTTDFCRVTGDNVMNCLLSSPPPASAALSQEASLPAGSH